MTGNEWAAMVNDMQQRFPARHEIGKHVSSWLAL